MSEFFKTLGDFIVTTVKEFIWWQDILDIAFVAVIIYFVLKFVRDTRAAQLLKGILLLLILFGVANLLNLQATTFLLNSTLEFGILAVLIVFQPELRTLLERMGRTGNGKAIPFFTAERKQNDSEIRDSIQQITDAVANMSATKTGALIVMEKNTKLGEIITTGTKVDATVGCDLILNIFYPKAPLHDGAAIIRDGRIAAAGCLLPLTTKSLNSDLGTRHRAGVGMSEISDATVILVSEETGIISVAREGNLQRRLSPDALKALLEKEFCPEEKKKESFTSRIKGGKEKK